MILLFIKSCSHSETVVSTGFQTIKSISGRQTIPATLFPFHMGNYGERWDRDKTWSRKQRACESLSSKSAEIVLLGEERSVEGGGQKWIEEMIKIQWECHDGGKSKS